MDTVLVLSSSVDRTVEVIGKLNYCIQSEDSAVFKVHPADSIQWYRNGNAVIGANDTLYRAPQNGTYYARIWSSLGCVMETQPQTVVIETPKPGITYPLEYAVIDKAQTLKARDFGVKVLWEPPLWLSNANTVSTTFKGSSDQLYIIRIETAAGCVTMDTQLVKTVKYADIYVPDAFTPNGDGLNDVLRPVLMGIRQLKYFRVFNRWGQMLYETKTSRAGWDGRIRGVLQPNSVVVWMTEGIGVDGTVITRQGTAVLIH
jgi:gliding motility-associated-like protein